MSALVSVLPILTVALGALLLMLAEALGKPVSTAVSEGTANFDAGSGRASEMGLLAGIVLLAGALVSAGVGLAGVKYADPAALAPYFAADGFSWVLSFVICLVAALAAFEGGSYLPEHRIDRTEFFQLLLWATVGALSLVASTDMLSLFVALETMSLGVYCLIGLRRTPRAMEAALKYFLLGSFAAALLLFGAALLYGATGRTDFAGIAEGIATNPHGSKAGLVLFGATLVVSGLLFKVAAVPFHAWTPDAYEGAPTAATAFMASVVKTAAFGVMLRVLMIAFGGTAMKNWGTGWSPVVATIAVVTMVFANVVAGRQASIKRMLAYSSIAHAGYALVGVAATLRSPNAVSAVVLYLSVYAIATCGAFGALMLTGSYKREATSYEDLSGLGRRNPAVALAFSVFLLSLAGIPPLAGFFGKLYVFRAAMEADMTTLVVIALLNSLVGAYYYVKVLVYMYMKEPAPEAPTAVPMRAPMLSFALVVAALLVLWIGILPQTAVDVVSAATMAK
jgi:NADH-quinone oxidoreductase subunit N